MLTSRDVCSVVVIYNGDSNLKKNIESLISQVDKVVAVDNCSTEDIMCYIQDFLDNVKFVYIRNDKNEGIARALNQGLEYAKENNYKLFLTMDQDSVLEENGIEKMIKVLNGDSSIASVGPNYSAKKNEHEYWFVNYLITSGNLTRTYNAIQADGYEDELFIDCVDFDFSLKLLKLGVKLAVVNDVSMEHKIGEVVVGKFLFFKKNITLHSPLRYYYIYRNNKYLINKYKRDFSKFCRKKFFAALLQKFNIRLFYPNKKEILKAIKNGEADFAKNKHLLEK